MMLIIWHCQFMFCCILLIVPILTVTSAQECPALPTNTAGTCFEGCSSDSDCSDGEMCCSNGCGHECMSPVPDPCATMPCPLPPCDESSPGTMTPEGQCCPVCACTATDGSMVAAGTSFMDDCNMCSCSSTGVALCTLIACASNITSSPTSTTPPAGRTCPKVQNTSEENCTDECSSDDDCQNDRICCSNGCGGHVCSDSVEMCALKILGKLSDYGQVNVLERMSMHNHFTPFVFNSTGAMVLV